MKNEIEKLRDYFLAYLKSELGRSDKTIENYRRYLDRFFYFCKIKKPVDINHQALQKFSEHLGKKTKDGEFILKPNSQNYHLTAVRSFIKYLQKQGVETIMPESVSLKKSATSPLPLPVVSEESWSLLFKTPNTNELEGKRDLAILELLMSTGLRVSELCSLVISDINFSHNEVSVDNLPDRVRTVAFTDSTKNILRTYLNARDDLEEFLFVRYGRKLNDGGSRRLSPRLVQRMINKYTTSIGLNAKITPQIIRNSFAYHLQKNGNNIYDIQAKLGHTDIKTTQSYLRRIISKN